MRRNRAVHYLCGGEADLETAVVRELGGFLRFLDANAVETPVASLHPATCWQVYGDKWPTLREVAVRLLRLPCSSAESEPAFKPLGSLLSRQRNRTLDGCVDKRWKVCVNSRALGRQDAVDAYTRSATERRMVELVCRATACGGGADGPFGGSDGPAIAAAPPIIGQPPLGQDIPPAPAPEPTTAGRAAGHTGARTGGDTDESESGSDGDGDSSSSASEFDAAATDALVDSLFSA